MHDAILIDIGLPLSPYRILLFFTEKGGLAQIEFQNRLCGRTVNMLPAGPAGGYEAKLKFAQRNGYSLVDYQFLIFPYVGNRSCHLTLP